MQAEQYKGQSDDRVPRQTRVQAEQTGKQSGPNHDHGHHAIAAPAHRQLVADHAAPRTEQIRDAAISTGLHGQEPPADMLWQNTKNATIQEREPNSSQQCTA